MLVKLGLDKAREIAGPRALGVLDCELTNIWKQEGVFELYRDNLFRRYANSMFMVRVLRYCLIICIQIFGLQT